MLAEKASHPFPTSTICKGGLMATTCVSMTHLACSFSAAKALIAQRYPSKLYARLVVLFKVLRKQSFLIQS